MGVSPFGGLLSGGLLSGGVLSGGVLSGGLLSGNLFPAVLLFEDLLCSRSMSSFYKVYPICTDFGRENDLFKIRALCYDG